MNRQNNEEPETQLSRNELARALKVEGLENRVLLAADLDGALDTSACMTDDAPSTTEVPAEVGQLDAGADVSSDVSSSSSVDADNLDEVMAEIGTKANVSGKQLASLEVDLPSGQAYDLKLMQPEAAGFRLVISSSADDGLMTSADTTGLSSGSSSSVGLRDLLGSSSLSANASATGSSAGGSSDSGTGTLGDDVSTDMAAPMVVGPMSASSAFNSALDSSVDAHLSGGTDLNTVPPTGVNLGHNGLSVGPSSAATFGLTTAMASPGSGTSMPNPGLGSLMTDTDLSGSVDSSSDTSMNSGLNAQGEWSNGWAVTGTHYSSDPTPEELYFRSIT